MSEPEVWRTHCLGIAPELPAADLEALRRFFCDVLDFQTVWTSDDSRLVVASGAARVYLRKAAPPIGPVRCHLDVDHVGPLYENCLRRGGKVVQRLRSQPWGRKEFVVELPEGHLLTIGRSETPGDKEQRRESSGDGASA